MIPRMCLIFELMSNGHGSGQANCDSQPNANGQIRNVADRGVGPHLRTSAGVSRIWFRLALMLVCASYSRNIQSGNIQAPELVGDVPGQAFTNTRIAPGS